MDWFKGECVGNHGLYPSVQGLSLMLIFFLQKVPADFAILLVDPVQLGEVV